MVDVRKSQRKILVLNDLRYLEHGFRSARGSLSIQGTKALSATASDKPRSTAHPANPRLSVARPPNFPGSVLAERKMKHRPAAIGVAKLGLPKPADEHAAVEITIRAEDYARRAISIGALTEPLKIVQVGEVPLWI